MNQTTRVRDSGKLSAVGMAIAFGILIAAISFPVFAVIVTFPDPGLDSAIREAIGKSAGDIFDSDLVGNELAALDGRNKGIRVLEGIQYCTDLTTLLLDNNQIVDISPLASLINLTTLSLADNPVSDISALAELPNLTTLTLDSHQTFEYSTPIDPISSSFGDTTAVLDSPSVIDFPDPALEVAIRNAIGKTVGDIYDSDLMGLEVLDASMWGIRTLEGIQHCVDLAELVLWGSGSEGSGLFPNEIVDISPLAGLTKLNILNLRDNQIVDISALAGLTNLSELNLRENQIVDISALAGLTNLSELNLRENQIVDIRALSGLANLATLILSGNQIIDIEPLSGLTNLETLFLDSNWIVAISALADNPGLGAGDTVELAYNCLELESVRSDINALVSRGATFGTSLEIQYVCSEGVRSWPVSPDPALIIIVGSSYSWYSTENAINFTMTLYLQNAGDVTVTSGSYEAFLWRDSCRESCNVGSWESSSGDIPNIPPGETITHLIRLRGRYHGVMYCPSVVVYSGNLTDFGSSPEIAGRQNFGCIYWP